MIKQLIFATEEELRVRVIITIVGLLLSLIFVHILWIIEVDFIMIGLAYMWGWHVIKRWFGITAFATIFSGSLLRSIFIVMAFFMIAAVIGMFYGIIALARYAYLMFLKLGNRQKA